MNNLLAIKTEMVIVVLIVVILLGFYVQTIAMLVLIKVARVFQKL